MTAPPTTLDEAGMPIMAPNGGAPHAPQTNAVADMQQQPIDPVNSIVINKAPLLPPNENKNEEHP